MMKFLSESMQRGVSRQLLVAQKNSPQFLFVGGVAGMVGSTVLACRATLKLQDVLEEAEKELKLPVQVREDHPEKYSDDDQRKDTVIIYIRTSAKIARMYAPAIVLGAASIGMLTKSHNILNERNAALTAAYAALDKGFREYRQRVVDKYGEEEDQRLRYETEIVVEQRAGKEKPDTRERVGPGAASVYARFFDQLSANWSKQPEYNKLFLRCQQNYANDLLQMRGHVFLNEVYRMLGLPHSKAGAVVGWLRSQDGDNYIDFGVFTNDGSDKVRDFVNGYEGSVLLDFNVDGVIYDKIEDHGETLSWQLGR
jgi:hypothetical protein